MKLMKKAMIIFFAILISCLLIPGCETPLDPEEGQDKDPDAISNTLLILQIGAATNGDISHSFVELYNKGSQSINLSGYSLQYAAGTKAADAATEDGPWQKINLSGTIEAGRSFLILGKKGTAENPALSIADNSGDMNEDSMELSNRAV